MTRGGILPLTVVNTESYVETLSFVLVSSVNDGHAVEQLKL